MFKMNSKIKRIGIIGGTFDPVHCGHLIIAENAREVLSLDKVLFIPSGLPPHKRNIKVTDPFHRYNMVQIAVKTNPYFEASRIELDRMGYTYTIDTLKQIKETYGPVRILFITGADVIHDLLTWKKPEMVFTMCEFIAAMRPEYRKADFKKDIEYLKANYSAVIHTLNIPLIGISSTDIRLRVENGKSIKYLVTEGIEEYILQNGLYK